MKNKSNFDHSALFLGGAPGGGPLVALVVFLVGEVLAVFALAVVAAGKAGLIALAIFFLAAALLAVAALDVLVVFDLHAEGVGVSVHQCHDRVASLLGEGLQVVASYAVAAVAGEVQSETVAVQFETF